MPVRFLTDAERERLSRFPGGIEHQDLITFFTLSGSDRARIPLRTAPHNRLGFALQLCAVRFMGFVPEDLGAPPPPIAEFVAGQLGVSADALEAYAGRAQTRSDHLLEILEHLSYRRAGPPELDALAAWLLERALEHDKPSLLFSLACERLRSERVLRPGVTRLERIVAETRERARTEIVHRLAPVLTEATREVLDRVLVDEPQIGSSRLAWLRAQAVSNTPRSILASLEKLRFLRETGVCGWQLDALNPNRLKRLAQIARHSSAQALARASAERRYPILVAFLHQSLVDITDESVDMFDRCLAQSYARARHDLADFRSSVARSTNEKLRLFQTLARTVLDPAIGDPELRGTIFEQIPEQALRSALDEADQIVRPVDDHYFDFLETRYTQLRQFTPAFLAAFRFRSNQASDPLLDAIETLRILNATGRRILPEDAPLDFVPPKWRPYVLESDRASTRRHYYELCVLWELRGALRAGNIWLEQSRRYANPESYLIAKHRWREIRSEVCTEIEVPEDGSLRLEERRDEMQGLFAKIDSMLLRNGQVRMEDGDLIVSRLEAEEPPERAKVLERLVEERLPHVELSDLLIEVDRWTAFSGAFEHAGGSASRSRDLLRHQYASVVAQGCNLGLSKMAQIANLSYDRLAWCTSWYLREETLKSAVAAVVNFQHRQPLSRHWGGGTLSSSDGQRFPVSGKVRNATALPRYFGYGKGVTFYTWTSDQFSQYGTKVIPATMRDATYVLDEILDNETELSIVEHTTDTAGYTDLVFALFNLLGMQFAPQIRDLGDQRLFRLDRTATYPNLEPQIKGTLNQRLILERWDDMLRVAGSLKRGWVTASLFIGKLQSYPRQNALTRALQEYGRLVKTIFILRYLESEEYRRQINRQLNKGEALHALREFLFFANKGKIRRKQEDAQADQATCLNLITNAVVAWNTVYIAAALDQLRAQGHTVHDDDVAYLSPARYEHVNPYGRYSFEIEEEFAAELRPLRQA